MVNCGRNTGYQRKNSCGYCKNATGSESPAPVPVHLMPTTLSPQLPPASPLVHGFFPSAKDSSQLQALRITCRVTTCGLIIINTSWTGVGGDQAHYITNLIFFAPAVPTTPSGMASVRQKQYSGSKLTVISLKASEFKPKRGQRQAVNRWNDFLLGPEYKRKAAMLCPQTREYVQFPPAVSSPVTCTGKSAAPGIDLISPLVFTRPSTITSTARQTKERANQSSPLTNSKSTSKATASQGKSRRHTIHLWQSLTCARYEVFLKYQLQVHKDPASRWKESAFKRFLCTGLDRKILKVDGKTLKLGSYHQCYRLDGKLVAVGVLDLLPHAVSSVYLL